MKKKRKILAMVCVAVASMTAGCGRGATVRTSEQYGEQKTAVEDTNWMPADTKQVTLQNEVLQLQMDVDTTHFTLTDQSHSTTYYSAVCEPLEGAQSDWSQKTQSELLAYYYDENGQKQEMNSTEHSVAFQTHEVYTNGMAIKVAYKLQLAATPPFVPQVLNEELYQKITDKLDFTTMFKMKLMYKFYDTDNVTTEAKEIRQKYEYAKDHAVYILNSNLNDSDRNALNQYMEMASYTQEQYRKDLEDMKITLEEDIPMQFVVPVVYSLNEEGFDVRILSEQIESSSEDYNLQSVAVLPYFNCGVVQDEDGFMLLPDGSGTVMKLDQIDNAGYSQKIYGKDMACENQLTAVNTQNAAMPLWGYSSHSGSWMSYIGGSSEMAKVYAYRAGNTEYCAHGYTEFELYSTDSFTMRKSTVALAVFSKNISVEQPYVKYILLEKQAGLTEMADWYRSYLQAEDRLQAGKENSGEHLYLEFTGYITEQASFMGISYEKKVILSTIEDIKKAVQSLYADGIETISVRLTGYGQNGGKYHGIVDGFSLESKVGTKEELVELAELLTEHGGGLYLEDDFFYVYRDTILDGFSSTSDSVRRMDKTLADISDADLVTGETDSGLHVRYLVSPKLYEGLAEKFRTGLTKKIGDSVSVSVADAGKFLVSDFSTKDEFDRVQTKSVLQKSMEVVKGSKDLMTDVGNEYVLGYAEHILNMPLTGSNFSAEDYSIPFYQLVLHGNLNYAGEAMNITKNQKKLQFDTLLSGASLFYSCVTDKEALESLEGDQSLYPVAFEVAKSEILSFYEMHTELYNLRAGKEVEEFSVEADGVYLISYKDGVSVVFNGHDSQTEWNGQMIEEKNYLIVRK